MADTSDSIVSAYDAFASEQGESIESPLEWDSKASAYCFCFAEKISAPNTEGLPSPATIRVEIPLTFPFDPPRFFPLSEEIRGFPHQDAETGKLCLVDSSRVSLSEKVLFDCVDAVGDWLNAAGAGTLLRPGDPYELPDFSRRRRRKELAHLPKVYFAEDEPTFPKWIDRIGQWGRVCLGTLHGFDGISPQVFRDRRNVDVLQTSLDRSAFDPKKATYQGTWLLLSSLCYLRHRPAQTFGEFRELCRLASLDFDEILYAALRSTGRTHSPCIILAGMPIPKRIGGKAVRIHWQPIFVDGIDRRFEKGCDRHRGKRRPVAVYNERVNAGEFSNGKPLLWGFSENFSDDGLYSRGALPSGLRVQRVSICGCGAIGSMLAEMLARGGTKHLSLFDEDAFELGNQCRHTLDGREIGKSKSHSLAQRLQSCNPFSGIRSYCVHFPLTPDEERKGSDPMEALRESDIAIDCGLSELGFQWLSALQRRRRAPLVSIFVNVHATMLTIVMSGGGISCREVLARLREEIANGVAAFSIEEYDPDLTDDEKILPELGCWHATFPARNNHLWMLVASAVDVLSNIVAGGGKTPGYACVLRRCEYEGGTSGASPLVEVALERWFE